MNRTSVLGSKAESLASTSVLCYSNTPALNPLLCQPVFSPFNLYSTFSPALLDAAPTLQGWAPGIQKWTSGAFPHSRPNTSLVLGNQSQVQTNHFLGHLTMCVCVWRGNGFWGNVPLRALIDKHPLLVFWVALLLPLSGLQTCLGSLVQPGSHFWRVRGWISPCPRQVVLPVEIRNVSRYLRPKLKIHTVLSTFHWLSYWKLLQWPSLTSKPSHGVGMREHRFKGTSS